MKSLIYLIFCCCLSEVLIAQNLIAHYPFNGSATDSVGIAHGSVISATLSTDRYQYLQAAYNFSGSAQYIDLDTASSVKPSSAITVSIWFELNTSGVVSGRSMISNTEIGGYNIQYIQATQTIRCNVWRNGAYAVINTSAAPYNNSGWHQAVLTYDGRFTKLYLDGILKGTNDAGAMYPINYSPTAHTFIGAEPTGASVDGNYYWRGKLDDIKIYDYALTQNEIEANYFTNSAIPLVGLKQWFRADSGIIMIGNKVAQWNDMSGNQIHLIQTDLSKQPEFIENVLNGKPVIRFDGIADILQSNASLELSNTPRASVFVVNRASNDASIIEQSQNLNTSSGGFYIIDNYQSIGHAAAVKGNSPGPYNNYISTFKSSTISTTPKIISLTIDKTQTSYLNQLKLRLNGTELTNSNGYGGTHTDYLANDTIYVGGRGSGGSNLDGDIAEIIIYDRLLTTSEISKVEIYLNQRYNVANTLAQNKPGSGHALTLDGVNDKVTIPSTNFNAYTIEAWVKFNGNPANRNIIVFTDGSPTSSWSHQLRTNSTSKFAHYTFDGSGNTVNGSSTIQQGKWYHVAITANNGGFAKLYINGIQEGGNVNIGNLWNSSLPQFHIGPSTGGAANDFNGEIDEVRIWKTERSAEQIRANMCKKISSDDSLFSDLHTYLNNDESSGNVSYDLSGNNRHGNLLNGTLRSMSAAPIGNSSSYNYNGAISSTQLENSQLGSFNASLQSGTANGIHVYSVHEQPNTIYGLMPNQIYPGYFGVFVVNGVSANYTAQYHYNVNGFNGNENALNLYKRNNNSDTIWIDGLASINTDSNTLTLTGQSTEYIINLDSIFSVFYHDVDMDGYGNANDSVFAFNIPPQYVTNNLDCNDTDSTEHPGQIWYTDEDGDHYSNGNSTLQCSRPLHGFVASELISISGDCNDTDSLIYPGSVHIEFSLSPNFNASLIYPSQGDSYTDFTFEALYFDARGILPQATFPRVILDFEGNGNYTNANDRTMIMTEDDVNDLNTADGKKYIATINALPTGLNWKTLVQTSTQNCFSTTSFGPFNYPDVLVQPDLEIFANDISFDIPNPAISSPLTITATIHNPSDFEANNFLVHLANQNEPGTVFPNMMVPSLAAHSSTTVSWNIITPNLPSWNPMEVRIDYLDSIDESNELDNMAIRPFINGNYNLPGSIVCTATASPAVSYLGGAYLGISGSAHYSGTAIPLIDSSVAGATINFTIVETGATFSTYTNSHGNFNYAFPKPNMVGIFHIVGTCTDFTLTGTLSTEFEIILGSLPICTLPDLTVSIFSSSNEIVAGENMSGYIVVKNTGQTTSPPSILSISQSGGTPDYTALEGIDSLAQFESDTIPFTIHYPNTGQYNLCVSIDYNNQINECSESNSGCKIIYVYPPLPDIVPGNGPGSTKYQCQVNAVNFTVFNQGGVNTDAFDCKVITKLNGAVYSNFTQRITNILPVMNFPNNKVIFNMPFIPTSLGNYTFELYCDSPLNEVIELNELNNSANYSLDIIACKPDFIIEGCEDFNVESNDQMYTAGDPILLKAKVKNIGNLAYNGNLQVRFALSSGAVYDTTLMVNLAVNGSAQFSKEILAPVSGSNTLTITADPNQLIDELNNANNSRANEMCWDYLPVPFCSSNFWDHTYLVNQTVTPSIGVRSLHLYDADSLIVKFEVSGPGISGNLFLGYGVMHDVKQTCNCPLGVSSPFNFVFSQTGMYTFIMTVDPMNVFLECSETNNVIIRNVEVTNLPDMRILSQHIAPSLLNPQPGQPITMNITYQNIGTSNINDQMKLSVIVDNTLLESIYPVGGLVSGGNTTIPITTPWSSNLVGVHVIRASIDEDHQITETNENNNEATRAIVVGESANLYFQSLSTPSLYPTLNTSIQIQTQLANNGDLACTADLALSYVDNNLDTILINTTPFTIAALDSINVNIPWIVVDNKTRIIGRIINSSILEYTYDDNEAEFEIGKMSVITLTQAACNANNGEAQAYVFGGEAPFNYHWSNGLYAQTLIAPSGNYTVSVEDNTGQTISTPAFIDTCQTILNVKLFIQGYYVGGGLMTPLRVNSGELNMPWDVDSVSIELHENAVGYPLAYSAKGILRTDGSVQVYFPLTTIGQSYYIVVKHQNLISTWSANPMILNPVNFYDFTSMPSMSYGANVLMLETGAYGLYNGDVNQDENIDLLDYAIIDYSIFEFESGYQVTDLNGDGNVDLLDSPILETNVNNFIYSIHP
ncbi:MAG: hypothetical protein IPI46_12730 [Bacteroidetes bacterium]|nr:hypothetical protein [Bacteroidota bacterium]